MARDRLVLGCRGSSFLLGVGRPPGASSSPAWLEDNLARLGSWKMPEFLQWRASEIQHLLWGCCHQTQTDTLAPGRGWWGPLRGQGAECSGGAVFKRLCQVGEGSGWKPWPLQDFFPSLRALLRPCLFLLLFPVRHACFHKASLTRDPRPVLHCGPSLPNL